MNEIRKSPIPLFQSIMTSPAAALIGAVLCALFLFDFDAVAQTADRVNTAVDEQRTVTLAGNRHPDAIPRFDIGPADPDLPMNRMILVLQPSAAAQSSLAALAEAQNDPNSPQYHQWLTPDGYAERFGVSRTISDASANGWLSHGFQIEEVPGGRQSIIFSGSVAEVESAFHTSDPKISGGRRRPRGQCERSGNSRSARGSGGGRRFSAQFPAPGAAPRPGARAAIYQRRRALSGAGRFRHHLRRRMRFIREAPTEPAKPSAL